MKKIFLLLSLLFIFPLYSNETIIVDSTREDKYHYENFFEKPELRFLNENNEMVIITLSNDFIIHDFPTKRGRLNRTISCDKEKVEILDNFTSYTFKRNN